MERGGGGGGRGASINAASGVWKKISPPSFINLQDIKAEQSRGGRRRGAGGGGVSVSRARARAGCTEALEATCTSKNNA